KQRFAFRELRPTMFRRRCLALVLLYLGLLACLPPAITPASSPDPDATSAQQMAVNLRAIMVHNIPTTLYEARPGWGKTTQIPNGLRWTGKGLHVHPEVSHGDRNDGTWKHIRITAEKLADSLVVDVRNMRQGDDGKKYFDVHLAFDVQVYYLERVWKSGVKLYDGDVQAKMRVKLNLTCEATTRFESQGGVLPELVFRLRVTKADFQYDNLVVEHIPGIGGEGAKVIGDAILSTLRQVHPSLERDMIAKADHAIVKAADTKEIRVGLGNLFNKK